jgi:hypothetical protein
MATPWEACITRDCGREHEVGEDVIVKQLMRFQIPFYEEGFDDIVVVRTMPQSYNTNGWLEDLEDKMEDFDQKTPYHKYNLLKHCAYTYFKFITVYNPHSFDYWDGAWYHDIGKLDTQTFENDVAHYYCHENVGAYNYFIYRFYETDKFRNNVILDNTFLINYHMMPFNWKEPKTVEKYKKIFGEEKTEMLIFFNECDRNS